MRATALGLVLLLGVCAPQRSWAQTDDASRSVARDLATAGVEAFQKEQFADAAAKLDKAYRVLKVPSIGLWSARALVKVGQLVKASERYHEVVHLSPSEGDTAVQKQAQADAQAELDALAARIPRIVVKLEGATAEEARIEVDGAPMSAALVGESRPVDPGKHHVTATRGAESSAVDVEVAEGETRDAVLTFRAAAAAPAKPASVPPSPSPPPPAAEPAQAGSSKTLAFVALGVGVVGVGVGSVFGLRAKSKLDEANDKGCSGDTCPNIPALDANDAAQMSGNISTVAFIVGGVGLALGATLWLTAGSPSRSTAALGVGPGSVRLKAVW